MASSMYAQGVDPPALGSMGTLDRLDDPIGTPINSHIGGFKEMHKARACQRGWGAKEEHASLKGHDGS
jgi:hypothetical protein